jgi:protoporphyrinogen oxidase
MRLVSRAGEGCVVLGAGAAGLTAAYVLAREGRPPTVLERDPVVGGLARTEERDGFRFDLGGHRFYTKSPEVELLWHEILGDELLLRPRLSRIYYNRRFIDYPLDARELIRKLGAVELGRSLASYLAARMRPRRGPDHTFEQWVARRFGRRLFELFFRSYTEKVWGVSCSELRAEWAAQRIRELSFASAARSALLPGAETGATSLIRRFHYPRLGPGQMWETMRDRVVDMGGDVRVSTAAERLVLRDGRVAEVVAGGRSVPADQVISSLPLSVLPELVEPAPDAEVLEAARGLRYRDFLTVALVLDGADLFPDNWIYVHDPEVRVARVQNYHSWSPWMVPDPTKTSVGLEYFCFAGDELWSQDDEALVGLATTELERMGLAPPDVVERGWVVRVPGAYPIYDERYAERVATIRAWLEGIPNLQQVGRNGLHRYNNSDHSMLTAICAVENLTGAEHDVWSVNADSWYGEERADSEQPYRAAPELAARNRNAG